MKIHDDDTFCQERISGMRRITRSKARGVNNPPPTISYSPTSGTTTTGRGRPRGRPPGRKQHVEGAGEDETSLYHIIKNCKASLTNIVDDWIESYKVLKTVFSLKTL